MWCTGWWDIFKHKKVGQYSFRTLGNMYLSAQFTESLYSDCSGDLYIKIKVVCCICLHIQIKSLVYLFWDKTYWGDHCLAVVVWWLCVTVCYTDLWLYRLWACRLLNHFYFNIQSHRRIAVFSRRSTGTWDDLQLLVHNTHTHTNKKTTHYDKQTN